MKKKYENTSELTSFSSPFLEKLVTKLRKFSLPYDIVCEDSALLVHDKTPLSHSNTVHMLV